MAFLIILGSILLLWILYLIAKEFYKVAQAKGYSEKKYLWLPFLLGIIGFLLVIALPDRGNIPRSEPILKANDELPDL